MYIFKEEKKEGRKGEKGGRGEREAAATTETLKYLLSSPLQKKLDNPWCGFQSHNYKAEYKRVCQKLNKNS